MEGGEGPDAGGGQEQGEEEEGDGAAFEEGGAEVHRGYGIGELGDQEGREVLAERIAEQTQQVARYFRGEGELEEQDEAEGGTVGEQAFVAFEQRPGGDGVDHLAAQQQADAVREDPTERPTEPEQEDTRSLAPGEDGNRHERGAGDEGEHGGGGGEKDEDDWAEDGAVSDDGFGLGEEFEEEAVQGVGIGEGGGEERDAEQQHGAPRGGGERGGYQATILKHLPGGCRGRRPGAKTVFFNGGFYFKLFHWKILSCSDRFLIPRKIYEGRRDL